MKAKIIIVLFSAFFLFCCSQPEKAELCGGLYFYNGETEFCPYGFSEFPPKVYAKCNGQEYNPKIQTCSENGLELQYHCNGVVYEYPLEYCSSNGVVKKGTFADTRDNKEYKTVIIGEQTWMAENLNFEAEGSQCYNNDPENCAVYGRLYDWETAIEACPEGWDLPTESDYSIFADEVDDSGSKLKSMSGWKTDSYIHSYDSDEFGFSALPGGFISKDGLFMRIEEYGFWWLSGRATSFYARYYSSDLYVLFGNDKSDKISVRCIKRPS